MSADCSKVNIVWDTGDSGCEKYTLQPTTYKYLQQKWLYYIILWKSQERITLLAMLQLYAAPYHIVRWHWKNPHRPIRGNPSNITSAFQRPTSVWRITVSYTRRKKLLCSCFICVFFCNFWLAESVIGWSRRRSPSVSLKRMPSSDCFSC